MSVTAKKLDIRPELEYNYSMENQIEEKDLFQVVLDDDEQVVQVLHPHKGRAWFGTIVGVLIWSLFLLPTAMFMIIWHEPTAPDAGDSLIMGIISLAFWCITTLCAVIATMLWCRKTVYAWTNKRVLIRTGFIGVDYKSLDLNMVGALSVNVNLVDKLIRKNTGTIAFGSMASPMTTQNVSKFNFSYVYDPYRVYKDVKAYIDQKKGNK